MKIELDMYQTLALSVLVLLLGKFLRERVRVLEKFCIPAPVIGGVLFAVHEGLADDALVVQHSAIGFVQHKYFPL